jgi:hypothetical protein
MDGWMGGWVGGWMDGCGWVDVDVGGWVWVCVCECVGGWMDGWVERQTDLCWVMCVCCQSKRIEINSRVTNKRKWNCGSVVVRNYFSTSETLPTGGIWQ